MKVIYSSGELAKKASYGIGLGNFDGVHKAHEFLVNRLVHECKSRGLKSMIYTFKEHPANQLEGKSIKLISSMEEKIKIFESIGVDALFLVDFTEEFADMTAERFVEEIISKKCRAKLVVTGFNYRFGKNGDGDVGLLERMGEKLHFNVITVNPVLFDGDVISSTRIRKSISKGEMTSVTCMLGRHYSISGKVEYGNKIGTEIGFPTANIIPLEDFALPKAGVYYTKTILDGKEYDSITNIGCKPTVSKEKKTIIETHIFNFSGWLYGKHIEVCFVKMIRGEKKFADVEKLKKQIVNDINIVKGMIDSGIKTC